jgi:hypothetical protein
MLDAVQGRDTSVRDTIPKGGLVQGAQHPRIFTSVGDTSTLHRLYRFVPLRQVQARPTHINSKLSLCSAGGHSYVASLEVFRDGMVWSGAQYPRDALSKGCNIQEFSVGDTPVGDEITLIVKRRGGA